MSALPHITFVSEGLYTQEEFARWLLERPVKDDLNHYELLNGRIIMNPPAGWPAGEVELSIGSLLREHVRSRHLGRVFGPSQGFELPTGDTVGPDASFISQERWEAGPRPVPGQFLRMVPELIVEVISPKHAARDRVDKRIIYAQAGVREYSIVDLQRREVTVFHAGPEGRFENSRTLGEDQTLASKVLPELSLPVRELLVTE